MTGERITAELRKAADNAEHGRIVTPYALCRIADRIDDRAVALPVDRDGKPWHVGDEFDFDMQRYRVVKIELTDNGWMLKTQFDDLVFPRYYSHRKPTPTERIREIARALVDGQDGREYANELTDIACELEGKEGDAE